MEPARIEDISARQAWLLAARPKTLPAALAPVLVGTALAYAVDGFHAPSALMALLVAVLIQIGANLANDVYDYERGADTAERLGPLRVTQSGLLTPRQVRRGMWLVFALAAAAGGYLALRAGWFSLLIGALCILAALGYTAGPAPLAYVGGADLAVMIFFGFAAVGGTTYVQARSLPAAVWPAALAAGAMIVNILVVNNIRDIETDRKVGRRTIPVLYGRRAGLLEMALMFALAYLAPLWMVLGGWTSGWVLISLLSVPRAIWLLAAVRKTQGPGLNPLLGEMARLTLFYCMLLAVGLVLGSG